MQRRLQANYNCCYNNHLQYDICYKVDDLTYFYKAERLQAQRMQQGLKIIPSAMQKWTGPW